MTGRRYTYGQARGLSHHISVVLPHYLGLKTGDVIAMVVPNMPEFPIIFLGAASAGLIVSPANPLYTQSELARQFCETKVRAVVTVPPLLEKVQAALEEVPGSGGPVVVIGGPSAPKKNQIGFEDLIQKRVVGDSILEHPDPDCIACLPFSSGTTGLPKGVMLTHRNMVANLCQIEHPEVSPPLPEGFDQDRILAILPFFHIYGMNGVMNMSLLHGRSILTLPKFEAQSFSEAFAKFKPTVLAIVPPLCAFIAQSPTISPQDLSMVRFVTCGAAAAPPATVQQFIRKANSKKLNFKEGYGMTESSCLATSPPSSAPMEDRVDTVGVPIPNTEVKVVDKEGNALPMGEIGEILVRGPQIMKGYFRNEQATKESLTEDNWLRTGDIGYFRQNGYISLVDRVKEMIKVKGLQVSPTELESILNTMEGVADVAVAAVPDEACGEVPRAYVVKGKDSFLTEEDVIKFLKPQVAQFKQLKGGVRFVSAIPKNAAGKILRAELKNL
ncbi:uncharacterized protein LOC132201447 [Neocloeon triangulifer]|uniref:uncharacterized protein LOC132201447 n=1 Tax=Neocloeon triangulifer TaxID=2078957 RepID=UPI00286F4E59|nr:uncharacterized protein LOC132201447 [Neocloeon triangulifer]